MPMEPLAKEPRVYSPALIRVLFVRRWQSDNDDGNFSTFHGVRLIEYKIALRNISTSGNIAP